MLSATFPAYQPTDPRNVTPTTSLRQVTNRAWGAPSSFSTSYTSALCRSWQMSYVPLTAIKVALANWYVNQTTGAETGPGAASTVAVSIEYPRGTYTQLPFGGSATGSIANGATGLTDLTAIAIPAFTRFWIWIYMANATGMVAQNWSNAGDYLGGDRFQFNGANGTLTGAITDNASGVFMNFPSAVLGQSNRHVWGAFGDSLTAGVNDAVWDASGGHGFFGRALAKWGPHINMGCPGDKATWFAASHALRVALASTAGVTRGINAYGINDLNTPRTSAQLLADRETMRALFSFPMFDTTVTPFTSSTDNWKTAANQAVQSSTNNTQRTTFNAAQRAGIATSPGTIDVARYLETDTGHETQYTLSGGVWRPQYMDANGGGIHPASPGYEAVTPAMDAALALLAP